jgi:hypothetical protein
MATMLEEYTTEEQRSVVRFLWAKELNAKDVHKEMLPIYGGKCLSQSKYLYSAGFDALVKRWDKCIDVGRYIEK